jgi:hypothetical protein
VVLQGIFAGGLETESKVTSKEKVKLSRYSLKKKTRRVQE